MAVRIGLKEAKCANIYFKEWRRWKRLTQQELADRMETTKQTVSRIETGKRDWSKGYLEAFAHVISCSLSAPIMRPPGKPDANELLRDATPRQKELVIKIIENVVKAGIGG